MPSGRRSPLLSFTSEELRPLESSIVFDPKPLPSDPLAPQRRWYHYIPLLGEPLAKSMIKSSYFGPHIVTVLLILAPHPSLLYVLVDFHLQTLHQPIIFMTHLIITYTLTFMAFSSLIICVARDPGPANAPPSRLEGATGEGEEVGLTEALMADDDFSAPGRWCRKCWVCTKSITM